MDKRQFMKDGSIMQNRILSILITALILPFAAQTCSADERLGSGLEHRGSGFEHRGPRIERHDRPVRDFRRDRHDAFRGDIRRFREHDIGVWHGGHWYHGPHGGRRGWWWIAGGTWYFYPAPIYPYPDPYLPPVYHAPLAAGYWYYCDNPPGYYPYVAECRLPWHAVAPGGAPRYAP